MKFSISKESLQQAINQVQHVVSTRTTLAILSNVLLRAKDGVLELTTTDLDVGVTCTVPAEVEEEGATTLPARRLGTIIRELPSEDIHFSVDEKNYASIRSGPSFFKVVGLTSEEFPALPRFDDAREFTLPQAVMRDCLKKTSYAISTDETRYVLNGILFSFKNNALTMVATDGRRLAMVSKEMTVPAASAGAIILPAKTVAELLRLLGKGEKLKIAFNERHAAFQIDTGKDAGGLTDNIYLFSKVVEGNYPNYQQVIPKETHQRIKLERELFLQCVHRAALVTSEKSNSVKIKLTANLLEITASSPDFGEAHESMAISYSGPDLQVAFNPQFVMDPLRALTKDEVFFELKDEVSPGVFKTLESFVCVIMPVRLS